MSVQFDSETPDRIEAIRAVNRAAFPTCLEADLVDRLRDEIAPWRSHVALMSDTVIGHVLYTPVALEPTPAKPLTVLGLGPMAVHPDHQGAGIGSTLVDWSLSQVARDQAAAVVVLGHPEWYPRFGFQPAGYFDVRLALYAPASAFLALEFVSGCLSDLGGVTVQYHPAFSDTLQ